MEELFEKWLAENMPADLLAALNRDSEYQKKMRDDIIDALRAKGELCGTPCLQAVRIRRTVQGAHATSGN